MSAPGGYVQRTIPAANQLPGPFNGFPQHQVLDRRRGFGNRRFAEHLVESNQKIGYEQRMSGAEQSLSLLSRRTVDVSNWMSK
jgi:hypothetical protein